MSTLARYLAGQVLVAIGFVLLALVVKLAVDSALIFRFAELLDTVSLARTVVRPENSDSATVPPLPDPPARLPSAVVVTVTTLRASIFESPMDVRMDLSVN